MGSGSEWGVTPRQSIEAECTRRGGRAVAEGCARLIAGDYDDEPLLLALGGPAAIRLFGGGAGEESYWFRVWGTRGLLWAWDPVALEALGLALADRYWRVREMAAKVVARHAVTGLAAETSVLVDDPNHRVAAAATRALRAVNQGSGPGPG